MSAVVFYEKPGCLTNARQKALLERCGCKLIVRDLLSESWTRSSLLAFLEKTPVEDWFNPAAPRIRAGEIDPAALDTDSAMLLLLSDPILIRRPLLATEFGKTAGFDNSEILAALGVRADSIEAQYRTCSKPVDSQKCAVPR